jgi:hypothetical protein
LSHLACDKGRGDDAHVLRWRRERVQEPIEREETITIMTVLMEIRAEVRGIRNLLEEDDGGREEEEE